MKRTAIATMTILALTTSSFAAGYIPLGPKVYTPQPPIITHQPDLVTPQPDLVTPQPDLVETTPDRYESGGQYTTGGIGDHCPKMATMNGGWQTRTNVNADCNQMSINPGGGGRYILGTTTVTPQPDIITPQPDLVTPQPDIVTPQPDSCKQKGLGSSGLGWYSC